MMAKNATFVKQKERDAINNKSEECSDSKLNIKNGDESAEKANDPAQPQYLDAFNYGKLSGADKAYLEEHRIIPLKTIKTKFPNACYNCNICEYHCDSLLVVQKHVIGERHLDLKKVHDLKVVAKHLPSPCKAHIQALEKFINDIHSTYGLSDQDLEVRRSSFDDIKSEIAKEFPECDLQLYGSSLSGFGLKRSDINLYLCTPNKNENFSSIESVYNHLIASTNDRIKNVKHAFVSKFSAVHLVHHPTNLTCLIDVNNNLAVQTSELMEVYRKLDSRVPALSTTFSLWAEICRINKQSMGTLPSYTFPLMVVHFLQNCEPPVLPVLDREKFKDHEWISKNTDSIGLLWLKMLYYYVNEFKFGTNVINIRQKEQLAQSDKNWRRKLAIEDPFSLKRNVARALSHVSIFNHIVDRLRKAYIYFGIPRTEHKALFDPAFITRNLIFCPSNSKIEKEHNTHRLNPEASKSIHELLHPYNSDDFKFRFDFNLLTEGKYPPLICRICLRTDHFDDDCPDTKLPPIVDLPPMMPQFISILDHICNEIMNHFSPAESDKKRSIMFNNLSSIICQIYPDAKLELFGSSCNGFGFHNSDLDICITFEGSETGEGLEFTKIIENIAEKLQECEDLCNVVAIPTAKVPIVKFMYKETKIECDISLYNTLALHNTRMLKTYCHIDKRLQVLGYTLKLFAKICDIGAASKGSLSSYAYVLMVIHFLQQRKPAVLPVLQELYEGQEKPETTIEGWNVYFYSDLENLPKVWSDYGKNQESVGQLWVGLLDFYSKVFDFNSNVITIRQKEPLTRFTKSWMSKCLAIEDPFDLNHNLGSGLSRKMNAFILKAFIKGREVFGVPIDRPPPSFRTIEEYLFDLDVLTNGNLPPNDRGCYLCSSIGHQVKDCPMKLSKKERELKRSPRKVKGKNQNQGEVQMNKHNDMGDIMMAQHNRKVLNKNKFQNVGRDQGNNNFRHARNGDRYLPMHMRQKPNGNGPPELHRVVQNPNYDNSFRNEATRMTTNHRMRQGSDTKMNGEAGTKVANDRDLQTRNSLSFDDPAIVSCFPAKPPGMSNTSPCVQLNSQRPATEGISPMVMNHPFYSYPMRGDIPRFQAPFPFRHNPVSDKNAFNGPHMLNSTQPNISNAISKPVPKSVHLNSTNVPPMIVQAVPSQQSNLPHVSNQQNRAISTVHPSMVNVPPGFPAFNVVTPNMKICQRENTQYRHQSDASSNVTQDYSPTGFQQQVLK